MYHCPIKWCAYIFLVVCPAYMHLLCDVKYYYFAKVYGIKYKALNMHLLGDVKYFHLSIFCHIILQKCKGMFNILSTIDLLSINSMMSKNIL